LIGRVKLKPHRRCSRPGPDYQSEVGPVNGRPDLPDHVRSGTLPLAPAAAKGLGEEYSVETYNVYMDEAPAGDLEGEEGYEVEFRVVPNSTDDGDPENNAVLAGLDLVDLINLRDALQQEIDNYALSALETQAMSTSDEEELMP
jgi:hypothetical protein